MKAPLPNEILAAERQLGISGTPADFLELVWDKIVPGQRFIRNWALDCMSDHLAAVTAGEIRTLVINVPPGMTKSTLTGIAWPIWTWLQDPSLTFIFSSYSLDITTRDARIAMDFCRDKWFLDRWGDKFHIGRQEGESGNRAPATRKVYNNKGGARLATMTGGAITGFHGNIHGIDDPLKPLDIQRGDGNKALETAITYFRETLATRWKLPGLQATVVIMQRLHENDLAGHILSTEVNAVHVRLPMEYDPRKPCVTEWGHDPRTEEGELLNPDRFSREYVDATKARLGPAQSSSQLQQDPIPDTGTIFQRTWFRHYGDKPKGLSNYLMSVDCTFKDTADSDYVVIQVWAVAQQQFYLLDQDRGRWDAPTTAARIKAVAKKWPQVRAKLIEDKANGPAVIALLQKELMGLIPVNPEGGKISRANAVTPFFEAGNVWFPDNTPWCQNDLEPEMLKFPRGSHDDQVDALSQALTYLGQHRNRFSEAMKAVRGSGKIPGLY